MSTTNLIFILANLLFSCALSIKQPIKVDQHNISTPKTGIKDLVVTHYDCSPKQITNMQYYKLSKIGECKIEPADFKILSAQVQIISQIGTLRENPTRIHLDIFKILNLDKSAFEISFTTLIIFYIHTLVVNGSYIRDFNNEHIALFHLPIFPPQATPQLSEFLYTDIVYTVNLDAIPASYDINYIK